MPGTKLTTAEKDLLERWTANTRAYRFPRLASLEVNSPTGLRGIRSLLLNLNRPFTAICGSSAIGKSTLLSLCRLGYQHPQAASKSHQGAATLAAGSQFDDLFVTNHQEDAIGDFRISWTYLGNAPDTITLTSTPRLISSPFPERQVIFLGLARAMPARDDSAIVAYYRTGPPPGPVVHLDDDMRRRLGDILGRTYQEATWSSSGTMELKTISSGGRYSSLNTATGEDVLVEVLKKLQQADQEALVIIEDIETGLHPSALSRLATHLVDLCYRKRFQLIVTTRSLDFLDAIPRACRCLVEFDGNTHHVIDAPPTRRIMTTISTYSEPDIMVYCEDSLAESLIRHAVPGDLRRRLRYATADKTRLASFAEYHLRAGWPQTICVVWDGDVPTTEIQNWINSLSISGQKVDSAISRIKLPGSLPPERWIVEQLSCDEGHRLLAAELNENEAYARSLVGMLSTLFQHHSVFRELAQKTQLDEQTVATALTRAVSRLSSRPLESLRQQLERVAQAQIVVAI